MVTIWPVSQRYLTTLTRSHVRKSYFEVLKDGDVAATLTAGTLIDPDSGEPVSSLGGTVTVERATIRRHGDLKLLDVSGQLLPEEAADLFAPFSTEIRPWVGVRYYDAPTISPNVTGRGSPDLAIPGPDDPADHEYVPIGTLVITGLDSAYPSLSLSCYDRFWLLNRFQSPYNIAKGTNVRDALIALLALNVPGSRFEHNIPDTNDTTPRLTFDAQTDVADAAHKVALAAGWQLYCDPMGVFTAAEEPSIEDDAVMDYLPGVISPLDERRGFLARPRRSIGESDDPINAVVFTGENSDSTIPPVRGYAEDTNPHSLTYVGRIGKRTYFESSPLVTTKDQANKAARTTLRRELGIPDRMVVPVMTNFALEAGDVVHVVDDEQDIDDLTLIDSFALPIRTVDGNQELACRGQVLL